MSKWTATQFVDLLGESDQGKAFLINVWDSFRIRLVRRRFIREFFERCALEHAVDTTPIVTVRDVSAEMRSSEHHRALRSRCPEPHGDGHKWSTMLIWDVWCHHHVDRSLFTETGEPIPKIPSDLPAANLARSVAAITSQHAWCQSSTPEGGAWLGRPSRDNAHCWVSTRDLDECPGVPSPSAIDMLGSALEQQHALGLYHPRECWLMRYEFPARQARSLSSYPVARPTFADGGNIRFRVHHRGRRAVHYARHRWGATGHLGPRPAQIPPDDHVGRPERVTASLPVGQISGLSLTVVGRVEGIPNMGAGPEVVAWLCDGRPLSHLIANVKRLCGSTPR